MPRPMKAERPRRVVVYIPETLYARVELMLYNEALSAIPHGAISEWFELLIKREMERLDRGNQKVEVNQGATT